jgi:hypothetical protein
MHFDYAAGSPGWIAHLERAHGLVNAVARRLEEAEPSVHLAPAARHLERGLSALYDAFDGRADRATAIGRAHARFWDAAIEVARAGLPSAVDVLREVCAELIAAEEEFPRVPPAARAPVKLRAGADLPPLHTIERASLVPRFRVPAMPAVVAEAPVAELPEPTTFDELMQAALAMRQIAADRTKAALARSGARSQAEAEQPAKELEAVPVGFAFVPPAALEEDDFVRRWARVCFEEIGMLGVQRAPLPGEDWRACLALELRMVAAIDALAALGPVAIAHVEPMAMDAPAPDPMGMFAVAMIGGCLEGRDALACAERVLHRLALRIQ